MSKIDVLFKEIISYEEMAQKFDYKPEDYQTISQGEMSKNRYLRAIARMLLLFTQEVDSEKMDMRLHNKTGKVVIDPKKLDSIYRKLVKDLEE